MHLRRLIEDLRCLMEASSETALQAMAKGAKGLVGNLKKVLVRAAEDAAESEVLSSRRSNRAPSVERVVSDIRTTGIDALLDMLAKDHAFAERFAGWIEARINQRTVDDTVTAYMPHVETGRGASIVLRTKYVGANEHDLDVEVPAYDGTNDIQSVLRFFGAKDIWVDWSLRKTPLVQQQYRHLEKKNVSVYDVQATFDVPGLLPMLVSEEELRTLAAAALAKAEKDVE